MTTDRARTSRLAPPRSWATTPRTTPSSRTSDVTRVLRCTSTPSASAAASIVFSIGRARVCIGPLSTCQTRGWSGHMGFTPTNSTPSPCSQSMVPDDSSTKARTSRAFARQWLYSMIILKASSRVSAT